MSVDIRLNQMVDGLGILLGDVLIDDVELSVRTLRALKNCGVRTLLDAERVIVDDTLRKQHGIGPRAIKEVREIIASAPILRPPAQSESKRERALERVLEMFLSWTGALTISGNITRDAWCELVDIRAEAERVIAHD